jgi:hypothetical protein
MAAALCAARAAAKRGKRECLERVVESLVHVAEATMAGSIGRDSGGRSSAGPAMPRPRSARTKREKVRRRAESEGAGSGVKYWASAPRETMACLRQSALDAWSTGARHGDRVSLLGPFVEQVACIAVGILGAIFGLATAELGHGT